MLHLGVSLLVTKEAEGGLCLNSGIIYLLINAHYHLSYKPTEYDATKLKIQTFILRSIH